MKNAVYAGSFDPISNGHIDIIDRAAKLFDNVYVLVTENIHKKATFSLEERVEMIKKVVNHPNVMVDKTTDLVVNFAKKHQVTTIIRGLRNIKDFESEISLYHFNKSLDPNIETVILFPSYRHTYLSSSVIKELVYFNADISSYVPALLIDDIVKGIKKKQD
ncbi:MAG: pantetheine-phosphate adenylyltransferase [Acholeplasmatales bacterium]|jgi:pantetheine-phosphate adenylyltransferase|nr:pantetheine-phosphate adenylyltransferase [Acholeplasmataceae bacterium]MDY0114939.1 pantetheine-phosphate adenylyltransferase [Acholeplasmatales bacterium]MCK9234468.1 pantetheine-phosphate adenylyltransferase [Acholeplasmataceae bacterium]MCK9289496.1 pantetheine-phosphate adenylyltransferase [Acholeplasmataceae bacterium]MCK9427121.1 pantetheine-phosphate adenylyltransferase [Acholeplasmataceae bacterium]